MKLVLLYSHEKEPVTEALLNANLDNHFSLVKISLKNLLNDCFIFDQIHDDKVNIEWTTTSGEIIRNSGDCYLLNRVIAVPKEIFEEFDPVDRSYSLTEFSAYLSFAIQSFPNCLARPTPFGLSGNHFSLPRQWETVKKAKLNIEVPEYYLGNLSYIGKKNNLVYSTPHNYYLWKTNIQERNFHSFAFERPLGVPIFCCVMGEEVEIYPNQVNEEILQSDFHVIKEIAFQLSDLFKFSISEILLFYHDSQISFGMISSIPYSSRRKPWFIPMLLSFLKKNCLGKNCD